MLGYVVVAFVLCQVQLATGLGLPTRHGAPMAIIAHRGDLDAWPEDTAQAILAAAARGADGIEFDVQRSASGTWFVNHDASLDRTTDGNGLIAAQPDNVIEAATIDGGFGFDATRHHDIRVPRLRSVLDDLRGYAGVIYLDLQHARRGTATELVEMAGSRRIVVLCRDRLDAAEVKAADPDAGTILLGFWGRPPDQVDSLLSEASDEATFIQMMFSSMPATMYVNEVRFDEPELPALRRAWANDVSAFLTNHLSAALEARDALAATR